MMERILGIDPGGRTIGLAAVDARDGTLRWAKSVQIAGDRQESYGVRWVRLRQALEDIGPWWDLLGVEVSRRYASRAAADGLAGCKAIVMEWAQRHDLQYIPVEVSQVKRAALGKGGGPGTRKSDVVSAAARRWPDIEWTPGAADATFVAVCIWEEFRQGDGSERSAWEWCTQRTGGA